MSKGKLFLVSGPSGSGKDTLLIKFFEKCPQIKFSISSITRPMREGEREGEKYNFISREKFSKMIENGELLEHNEYVGNYYGTPKAPVEACLAEGGNMIVEIDVNGAAQIRAIMPEAVSIFILPPSYNELRRRLSSRGTEAAELVEKRMKSAMVEISRATEYDYIIVNDDLETAVGDMIAIVRSEQLKTDRQRHLINQVMN